MLKINNFKNAYGIKDLKVNIEDLSNSIIYASNGVFKTSFASTFYNLSIGKGNEVEDRLTNKKFSCELEYNGKIYTEGDLLPNVIVYSKSLQKNKENNDLVKENDLNKLLILRKDHDEIKRLMKISSDFHEYLVTILKSIKMKENDLVNIRSNKIGYKNNILFEDDLYLIDQIKNAEIFDTDFITGKELSSKPGLVLDSENFKQQSTSYKNILQKRLINEVFDENFNETNLDKFLKVLKDTEFLNENRKILINKIEFDTYNDIHDFLENEIKKLSKDPEIIEQATQLKKLLGTTKNAQKIKTYIEDPKKVLILNQGTLNILLSKIKDNSDPTILDEYERTMKDTITKIKKILESSKSKKVFFEEAVELYNDRFCPPFKIKIRNRQHAVFGLETPQIVFSHNRNASKELNEKDLRDLLSSGEKTALSIIHLIVQYLLQKDNHPLIIMDDIIETFDYANRTAFIEYINDIMNDGCRFIILTHNFEFYRTLKARLNLNKKSYDAKTDGDGNVVIERNKKLLSLVTLSQMRDIKSLQQFITVIPFIREIINFEKGTNNEHYLVLTSTLHYKKDTDDITLQQLQEIYKKYFENQPIENIDYSQKFIDCISNIPITTDNFFDLRSKLLLSMKCRLFLEKKIIGTNFKLIEKCSINQTRFLKNEYGKKLTSKVNKLLDSTLLMTSEFIHLNSFMYEPLVDIDPKDLDSLFNKINNLTVDEIWK